MEITDIEGETDISAFTITENSFEFVEEED